MKPVKFHPQAGLELANVGIVLLLLVRARRTSRVSIP